MYTFIIAGVCILICIVVIYVSLRILADSRRIKKTLSKIRIYWKNNYYSNAFTALITSSSFPASCPPAVAMVF